MSVTDADISAFYDTLAACGTKPALLSIVPKYSSNYMPKWLLDAFPEPLSMLHKLAYMEVEYHELVCDKHHDGNGIGNRERNQTTIQLETLV